MVMKGVKVKRRSVSKAVLLAAYTATLSQIYERVSANFTFLVLAQIQARTFVPPVACTLSLQRSRAGLIHRKVVAEHDVP